MEENNKNQEPIWQPKQTDVNVIISIVFIVFFVILFIMFFAISIINTHNEKIISGIFIKDINVSGLAREEAIEKVNNEISKYMSKSIVLKHNEYSTEISLEQLNATFDVEDAVDAAYKLGRSGNIIKDGFKILETMFSNKTIDPVLTIDSDVLKNKLEEISSQLPDTIVQSSYYIEGNDLIVTKGKTGYIVNVNKMFNIIRNEIQKLNFEGKIYDLEVIEKEPEKIDIQKIHDEIYKDAVNASFTTNPYSVHPSEDGVDFNISMEQANEILKEEKEEYVIPLKIIKPEITTNMLGTEAFPDLLSEFSTRYNARQTDRTTNLRLAAEKINGTVVMPGETFSYNTVVGKRTIDAGYKDAKIYVNGEVVDGLGGGICQVSTTLYNAALYANLEIVERRNHQFVPSYIGAGLDATVVYGSIDFKFKNTRNYPIKIVCSVENGICNFKLFGLKQETEYEIGVGASIIGRSATSIKSKTYRTLKLNGEVVDSQLVSSDTYKSH